MKTELLGGKIGFLGGENETQGMERETLVGNLKNVLYLLYIK
jgi:hypothetical protein